MTHINAYFADVDDAKARFEQAKGDLAAAEARLEAKKLEDGYEEPKQEEVADESKVEEKEPEPKEELKPHAIPVRRK